MIVRKIPHRPAQLAEEHAKTTVSALNYGPGYVYALNSFAV